MTIKNQYNKLCAALKSGPTYFLSRYVAWYRSSFANRLTILSLTLALLAITLVTVTAMLIVFTVVTEKERELSTKDLSVGAARLSTELIALDRQVRELAGNAALVNSLIDASQRNAYIQPLLASISLANVTHYQIILRNYRGERLLAYDHAIGFIAPDEAILKSHSQVDLSQNIPSAHMDRVGSSDWLGISYPVAFPDSNDAQGLVTLELPISDLLGTWLAPERDPRDWQLRAQLVPKLIATHLEEDHLSPEKQTSVSAYVLNESLNLPAPLDALGLHLYLQGSEQQAWSAMGLLLPYFLLIGFLSSLLAAVASRWMGLRLAKPISALANFAREVAITGAVKTPSPQLQGYATDEVGRLTRDFSSMLAELALLQEHLNASIAMRSARLATIFELSPDGFIAFDARGVASFVNPAFTFLTGIERDEVLAHDWAHLCSLLNKRLPAEHEQVPNAFPEQYVLRLQTPSLKTFLVFRRVADSGEVILYWRDFTREAEMDAMKTAFLAKAAHELRTPLTSILGFTELLQKDAQASDKQKEIFAIMARQGASLLRLVRDLLDLARIEAQQSHERRQIPQSLSALTRLIVEEFRVPGDERKINLSLADHLPELRLDAGQYRQMLSNLLSNALKYSPAGTPILVSTERSEREGRSYLVLTVRDYGIGMSQEELARLGERFYRAQPQGSVTGTGLGLSVVQELMTAHGGFMEFESTPGQGTSARLWFALPQFKPNTTR